MQTDCPANRNVRAGLMMAAVLPLALSHSVQAMPASPHPFTVQQPDGTAIQLHIRGDEYFHWLEDLNGYTVVVASGEYVYAIRDASGNLAPTELTVGRADPQTNGLTPRILPSMERVRQIRTAALPAIGATRAHPQVERFAKSGEPEPVNIGGGEGACCDPNTGECTQETSSVCNNLGNIFQGVGTFCGVCANNPFLTCSTTADCPACEGGGFAGWPCDCPGGGTCTGANDTCEGGDSEGAPCDPVRDCGSGTCSGFSTCEDMLQVCATAACCDEGTGDCVEAVGTCPPDTVPQGFGTDCDPNPCDPGEGACCDPSTGECTQETPSVCNNLGNVFQGAGTVCPGTCDIQACCDEGTGDCVEAVGTCPPDTVPKGLGTHCDPNPCPPPDGTLRNLVIMMRFSNQVSRDLPSDSDIDTLFNAMNGHPTLAPTGSVRDVYLETSYGLLTLDSTVVGWVDLPETEQYYAKGPLWEGIVSALEEADPMVDFRQFDGDGDGFVDLLSLIHSGYGAEWGGSDCYGTPGANRIWSHMGGIWPHWTSAEGVKVDLYQISPAVWGTCGSEIGHIGVICHEIGHLFELPDLYDVDMGGDGGIGSYGMMANSWGFTGDQLNPPHFSAWSKIQLGWIVPTVITMPGMYTAPQVETNPTVFRIDNGYPSGEYLLIENRQPVGIESTMPQGGLAIWHIDEAKCCCCNYWPGYPGQSGWPENGNHYWVALLQADGRYDLERGINRGDGGDLYHADGVNRIDAGTVPNTDAYQDGNIIVTNNTIYTLSAAGPNMLFTFKMAPPTIDAPQAEPIPAAKNRYVSFLPGNPGRETAIRVLFTGLPAPFDIWDYATTGQEYFVGEPFQVCENSGQGRRAELLGLGEDCAPAAGFPRDWFWAVPLVCDSAAAHFTDWNGQCNGGACLGGLSDGQVCSVDDDCAEVIHLYNEGIVPLGAYAVQAIDEASDPGLETSYSAPLKVRQAKWGDVCGPSQAGGACSAPPDGVVAVTDDVLGVLGKFTNTFSLEKARADLEPGDDGFNNGPDFLVNVTNDVLYCLDAFTGASYPFVPGDPCGPG